MTLPKDIEEAINLFAGAMAAYGREVNEQIMGDANEADYKLREVIARELKLAKRPALIAPDLRPLNDTPTQRQRYKEAFICGGHPLLSACALADDAVIEDAEHAKK